MRFEFSAPARIIFGPGVLAEAGPLAAGLGRRALVVLGTASERAAPLLSGLAGAGLSVTLFRVRGEPTVETVREGIQLASGAAGRATGHAPGGHATRQAAGDAAGGQAAGDEDGDHAAGDAAGGRPASHAAGDEASHVTGDAAGPAPAAACDVVIGFGGGSALDTAKAIAVLAANGGDVFDYLEVIGRGRTLDRPGLPCIAIPTTAGTGSEVTRNAVLASPEHRVKVSLRSPFMLPRVALVDPRLTHSLPPAVTAATGLDALTQVLEPFVSVRATPVTDALCRDALARAARSLRRVYADGADAAAREDMSIVSLFGGLALANAGLGTVHGFAGVLGGMLAAPHGALCARLLPLVVEANVAALRARDPANPALPRYDEVGRILTGRPAATAGDAAAWLAETVSLLGVPSLRAWGLAPGDVPDVIAKTAVASSTKANPIVLSAEELGGILERAL